jgi:hypothetical protein
MHSRKHALPEKLQNNTTLQLVIVSDVFPRKRIKIIAQNKDVER